jgi:hypothetical protein
MLLSAYPLAQSNYGDNIGLPELSLEEILSFSSFSSLFPLALYLAPERW